MDKTEFKRLPRDRKNNQGKIVPEQQFQLELKAYNLIEIGESKFIFVNLCGENFDWNKEKSKSDKEVL